MKEPIYTIYNVFGSSPMRVTLLVNIAPQPDNWETFSSAIFRRRNETLACEYNINEWLTGMWQTPSGQLYAVSMDGRVHTNPSDDWKVLDLGKHFSFNHIWGADEDLIYCCGLEAVVFRKVNNRWERFDNGLKGDLRLIGGTSPNDLYILGKKGQIFHYDGIRWSDTGSPTNYALVSILCVSEDEVYLAGRRGMFFRGSWKGWKQFGGVEFNLYALAKYHGTILVGAGLEGILVFDGKELVIFDKNVLAYGLQVIEDRLFAFGERTLQEFDGKKWHRADLDFAGAIAT